MRSVESEEIVRSYIRAVELINDYCMREFGYKADFSDIEKIGIAYTTTEEGNYEVQVCVNLNEFRLETYLDNHLVDTEQYESLHKMNENCLVYLNFDDLVYIPESVMEAYRMENIDLSKDRETQYHLHHRTPATKRTKKEENETR